MDGAITGRYSFGGTGIALLAAGQLEIITMIIISRLEKKNST